MFSCCIVLVGFAVAFFFMRQRRFIQYAASAMVGDIGLMCLCNGIYFASASGGPRLGEIIAMFAFLCLFSPLGASFFLGCLPVARDRFKRLKRAINAGTALVFVAGMGLALAGRSWATSYAASYGWIFVTSIVIALAGLRELRAPGNLRAGTLHVFWLFCADVAISGAMFAAQATVFSVSLMGLWFLLTGSIFGAFFIATRPRNEDSRGRSAAPGRYEHSKLDNVNVEGTIARLEGAMWDEKLFRDPDLRLNDLAKHIGINTSQLSELINLHVGQSFSEYVNAFRVEEAKRELAENSSHTIIGVGFDCGFNSKSSFNAVFRKSVGMSPSEFRKRSARDR